MNDLAVGYALPGSDPGGHTFECSFQNVELDKFARVFAMLQPGRVALGVSHRGEGPDIRPTPLEWRLAPSFLAVANGSAYAVPELSVRGRVRGLAWFARFEASIRTPFVGGPSGTNGPLILRR
jgi:hypothetical protein